MIGQTGIAAGQTGIVGRIDRTVRFSGLGRKVLQTGWTGMADRTDRYSRQDRQTVY